MKAKKLTDENIEFINKCCDNRMFNCDNCKYKFSKTYHTSNNTDITCVCDLRNITFLYEFEDIAEVVDILSELGEEEIGDIV